MRLCKKQDLTLYALYYKGFPCLKLLFLLCFLGFVQTGFYSLFHLKKHLADYYPLLGRDIHDPFILYTEYKSQYLKALLYGLIAKVLKGHPPQPLPPGERARVRG